MVNFYALDFCVLGYDASDQSISEKHTPSFDDNTNERLYECCKRFSQKRECSGVYSQ